MSRAAGTPRSLKLSLPRALAAVFAVLGVLVAAGPSRAQEDHVSGVRILALGTSLTAGYGLPPEDGFTARLQAALVKAGHAAEVINAGVSGDTSADALARLDWVLDDTVTHAIVELGSNDALRGLTPQETEANLSAILDKLAARGIPVLLAGMHAPRNLGPDYVAEFDPIYPKLAGREGVTLYPFFLDGVALNPELNQADKIHPNAEGVVVIVERMLPYVIGLIGE